MPETIEIRNEIICKQVSITFEKIEILVRDVGIDRLVVDIGEWNSKDECYYDYGDRIRNQTVHLNTITIGD